MALDPRRLQRVHRVRTLQLGLAQAEEARARETVASEAALSERIARLADAVAPQPAAHGAVSLAAAAHYRERLHQSAAAAAQRVRAAEAKADHSALATQAAKRDQTAAEKLLERSLADRDARERRAMEEAPATRRAADRTRD